MLSRIENILQSIVDSSEYDGPVQSRIEQLLLDIKSVISAGGSGGVTEATVSTMITTAINSLIDSAPDEYNTLGKIAAHILLTDEQIRTITEQVNNRYTKEETNELVSKIPKFTIEVVTSLPTENISTTTVYLKTGSKSDPDNIYDEYIYVNSKWELLGTQKIDLTNFYTKEETGDLLNNKVDKVSGKGLSTNDFTATYKTKLDGIATGANKTVVDSDISTTSTNPVQNKAVGLKFQGVDSEISGINSTLTEKTAEIATIVNEYGSKNLADPSLIFNTTVNGVTRKNNGDGSITLSGTSTAPNAFYLPLIEMPNLGKGTYIFTPNQMTDTTYIYQIYKDNRYWNNYVLTKTIEITEAGRYSFGVGIRSNMTISNTFKPMLRYAAIKDDTYVQYAMTNRELTEQVIDTGWKTTGNLKYSKSGYIVSLQGSVTPSGSTMSITLGTLPEDCRPTQDITIAQAWTDVPFRRIIVQTDGNVVLLFESNCTASHTYSYNGIFMV